MEEKGRKFSPEHAVAWNELQLTAAKLIRAVEEGCVVLNKSAVVDGRLFIYQRVGRYTMVEPYRRIGIVDNIKGDGFTDGILHDDVYKFTDIMEGWLKEG